MCYTELLGTVIYFPWWFPGASFKKDADTYKHRLARSRDTLHDAVKKALVRAVLRHSTRFFNGQSGGTQRYAFHCGVNDY